MAGTSRQVGQTGARGIITGVIPGNATWYEDLAITEDGGAVAGSPELWEWKIMLRVDYDSPPELVISTATAGSILTVVPAATETTLQIRVPYTTMQNLDPGDYLIDIASKDVAVPARVIAWGHGVVTVREEPSLFD